MNITYMRHKKKTGSLYCTNLYRVFFFFLPPNIKIYTLTFFFSVKGFSFSQKLMSTDCLGSALIHQQIFGVKKNTTDWFQNLPIQGSHINKSLEWEHQKHQLLSPNSLFEYLGTLTLAVLLEIQVHKDQGEGNPIIINSGRTQKERENMLILKFFM